MIGTLFVVVVVSSATAAGGDFRPKETCVSRPWSSQPRPSDSDDGGGERIVDAPVGSAVKFLCNYCDEKDKGDARFWYISDRHGRGRRTTARAEVALGMADPPESNRVHMTADHSLVIRNLTSADAARYTCSGLGADERVRFALDLVPAAAGPTTVSGDSMADWTRYEARHLAPVTRSFPLQVREMAADWDAWGPCDGCAGKRYRRAACRVRLGDDHGTRAACRSIVGLPATVSPALAATLSSVPDFLLAETCYAYCKLPAKNGLPKYRNMFTPEEGSSLTLVCAEATASVKVVWRRDGLLLSESVTDVVSGVLLDKFGTLYLVRVTAGDSGNYTCYVDGHRMQEVLVVIRKSYVLGSEEFARHLCYLCYVFGLNLVVFVVRVYYAWLGRHSFAKVTENDALPEDDEFPLAYLGKKIRIR